MSHENVCANVSTYRRGQIQQGYSLNGDRVSITLRAYGFSIVVEMQDEPDEGRVQASVRICGNEVFNTEDHVLKAPDIVEIPFGKLEEFTSFNVLKESRASVALDGQTQSETTTVSK